MSGGDRQSGAPGGYLDFEVEVGVGRGREYPVVVRSPAGGARDTMRFPFDELALENRLLAVQNVLLRGIGLTRSVARAPEERTVEEFGRALFDALLPGEARSRYDLSRELARGQGKGLRLRLQVRDPALAALPWEFLYDPRRDYVCLSQRTPLVRHLEVGEPVEPLAVAPPLRILAMAASPRDLPPLDAARERERMERALAPLRAAGRVELTWLGGQTWADLQEAMWRGPWHAFHFVGHGGYDARTDEGHLVLADEGGGAYPLGAVALGRLLNDHYPLRLAVLNACEGARGGGPDLFSGTAATLVRMGLPAVVAMQYPITDRAAITFAGTFYRALGAALPVDGAVGAARQAVGLAAPASLEWGTPVLYLRAPDAVLFGFGAPAAPESAEPLRLAALYAEARPRAVAPPQQSAAAPTEPPPTEPPPGRRPPGDGGSGGRRRGTAGAAGALLVLGVLAVAALGAPVLLGQRPAAAPPVEPAGATAAPAPGPTAGATPAPSPIPPTEVPQPTPQPAVAPPPVPLPATPTVAGGACGVEAAVRNSNAVWEAAIKARDAGLLDQVYTAKLLADEREAIARYRRENQTRFVQLLSFRVTDCRLTGGEMATLAAEEEWTDRMTDAAGRLIRSKDPWKIAVTYDLVLVGGRWLVGRTDIRER